MDNGNLTQYFKSIVDQDRCAVVICNTAHEIIYMNPAARYMPYHKSFHVSLPLSVYYLFLHAFHDSCASSLSICYDGRVSDRFHLFGPAHVADGEDS